MPTQPKRSTTNTFDILRKLSPPQTLIHVGAGTGIGPLHHWHDWDIPNVVLIDADIKKMAWAELKSKQAWEVVEAVVGEAEAEQTYYQASNAEESGLVNPETLKELWPNLKTTTSAPVNLKTLDALQGTLNINIQNLWLYVDCLPVLEVLKGAKDCLDKSSVLCLRVLLRVGENLEKSVGFYEVNEYLKLLGFCNVEIIDGFNPSVSHAVFVRQFQNDVFIKLEMLRQENSKLNQIVNSQQIKVNQIDQLRDRLERSADVSQAKIDLLNKEKNEIKSHHEGLKRKIIELEKSKVQKDVLAEDRQKKINEINQVIENRQVKIKELNFVIEENKKLLSAKDKSINKHMVEHAELLAELGSRNEAVCNMQLNLDKCKDKVQVLEESLKQAHNNLKEMEVSISERDSRQQMLNDEMKRAEAQIDLIKDVLLRDAGL